MTSRLSGVRERLLRVLGFLLLAVEGVEISSTSGSVWSEGLTIGFEDGVAALSLLDSFATSATQPLVVSQLAAHREVLQGGVLDECGGVLGCGFGGTFAGWRYLGCCWRSVSGCFE